MSLFLISLNPLLVHFMVGISYLWIRVYLLCWEIADIICLWLAYIELLGRPLKPQVVKGWSKFMGDSLFENFVRHLFISFLSSSQNHLQHK